MIFSLPPGTATVLRLVMLGVFAPIAAYMLCAVICRLNRRASAATRHLVWMLAFVMMAVCVPITFLHIRMALPILPSKPVQRVLNVLPPSPTQAPATAVTQHSTFEPQPFHAEPAARVVVPTPTPHDVARESYHVPWSIVIPSIWAIGFWGLTIQTLAGLLRLRGIVHRSCPANAPLVADPTSDTPSSADLPARARILLSDEIATPLVTGLLRPAVILPEAALKWPAGMLRAALTHESAHIRRNDLFCMAFARFVAALYWFNPMVWLALRAVQAEAEMAADDSVVVKESQPIEYAESLVALVHDIRNDEGALFPAIGMLRGRGIHARVERILDPSRNRLSPRRVVRWTLLCATALATAGVLIVRPVAALPPPAEGGSSAAATGHAKSEPPKATPSPQTIIVPSDATLVPGPLSFATPEPPHESWQALRAKQPAGLHLTLTLPKTRYYLGEVISAKLTFSNQTKDPYHVWMGTYDRSGRIPDIEFRAESEDGSPISDPLRRYFGNRFSIGGGIGNHKDIGEWEITLPANQWLKFTKPGTYKLYAHSTRIQPGDKDTSHEKAPPVIELVSDPVAITIDPLSAEEEMKIIKDAMQVVSGPPARGSDDPAFDAMARLRYLQTPAANDALLQLVDSRFSGEAVLGLHASMEDAALAQKIMQGVGEQKLGLSRELLQLYAEAKNGGNIMFDLNSIGNIFQRYQDELTTAAKNAMTEEGRTANYFANLWTTFRNDPHDATIRAQMIKRQLDLPQKQVEEFLKERFLVADKDFLPLLREWVKPEKHDPHALEALAFTAPNEARPIIIEDIKRDRPIYIPTDHYFRPDMDFYALQALPEREIPELDPILQKRLADYPDNRRDFEAAMILIERYATPALLPDVVRIYRPHEGHWACIIQGAVLRYWIHCRPAEGVEALGRALAKNAKTDTGCYHTVLRDVLEKNWVDEALPLVMEAMKNEDLEVVRAAAPLLEAHAGPEAIESIIAAIERIAAHPVPEKGSDNEFRYVPRMLTTLLIDSKRWTLTRPQFERLQKVAIDKALKTRIEEKEAKTDFNG